ncbi:MAG: MerR family transcriptional regulator [Chloroflexi bacterium]|nr:MerR family transcriptional regulator [Chloroflexota bacterium]
MADGLKTMQQSASELGVTPSTLKRWAKEFASFLSPAPMGGDGAGRRFSEDDVAVLRRVREQLAGGLSTDEVVAQFEGEGRGETSALALSPRDGAGGAVASPGFAVLTDTLRAMIENQQAIQNSLQVNRNLQGVLIQDNFNLKEENMKLRERMQRMEQELSDLRKRDADHRLMLEQRLARLEVEMRKGILGKLF